MSEVIMMAVSLLGLVILLIAVGCRIFGFFLASRAEARRLGEGLVEVGGLVRIVGFAIFAFPLVLLLVHSLIIIR